MGAWGSKDVPASTTKSVSKGVGFAGKLETIQNKEGKLVNNNLVNNTAFNSVPSLQATIASFQKIIPVWMIRQHKPWLSASTTISSQVWKKIKLFKNVGGIQSASNKFKVQWAEFDELKV